MNKVEIVLANTGERMMVEPGTQLFQLAEDYVKQKTATDGKAPWPVLGALVNNKVEPLQYRIYNPKTIQLLDITSRQGFRMYRNALTMMLYTAVHDCYPKATLCIDHSMQNGFYCRIMSAVDDFVLPDPMEVCTKVRERMIELQEQDIPFSTKTMLLKDEPALIARYRQAHSREESWREILDGIREVGILEMEVYLVGNTIVMVVETPLDFEWDDAMSRLAALPRQAEWEEFVAQFQQCDETATSDEKWKMMERIFHLYE